MKCENCGKYILDNSKECEFCGAPQENKIVKNETVEPPKETIADKKWFSLVVGIVASIVLVVIIVMLVSKCGYRESTEQAGLSYGDTKVTENVETTTTVPIEYNLSETETFKDISFNYDDSWDKTTDTDSVLFTINKPNIQIDMWVSDYDDNVIEATELLEIYKAPSDYETLINSEDFYIKGSEPAVRVKLSVDKDDKYREIIAFSYNNNIYSIYIYADMDYKDDCNNIMTDILASIVFNEIESTEEPTTEKITEPSTEKETEPPIVNNTSTGGWWANGTGDYVASGLTVTNYGVLHIEYNGEGYFSVKSYENDEYDELLVSNVGSYSGDVLIDHSGTFDIVIESEGDWSITSSGLKIDDTTSFSGYGDAVTGITSHDGGNWKITYEGDSYFSVKQYGMNEGYMDLLVSETESYSGIVKSEKGDDVFFVVTSEGNWSINKQ